MFLSAGEKGVRGGCDRPFTAKVTGPWVRLWRCGALSVAPTISSASSLAVFSLGSRWATHRPRRKIVAASHSWRISSSLWLIYRMAVPCADNLRRVLNKISTSLGVKTEVGSSMISNFGSCKRQRIISTLWRSPAERSRTIRRGSSGRP